jgi:hypothetical protein
MAKVIDPVKAAKAAQWVKVSNWLAGGGIGGIVLGIVLVVAASSAPVVGIATLGGFLIGIGAICATIGGVIGQVGRGMQGRAI